MKIRPIALICLCFILICCNSDPHKADPIKALSKDKLLGLWENSSSVKLNFGEAEAILEGLSISNGTYTWSSQSLKYEIENGGIKIKFVASGGETGLAEVISENMLQVSLSSWNLNNSLFERKK